MTNNDHLAATVDILSRVALLRLYAGEFETARAKGTVDGQLAAATKMVQEIHNFEEGR